MILHEHHGQEREEAILAAARDGRISAPAWMPVRGDARGHSCTVHVSADALMLDGVRVNATATTSQLLADHFGALLPTSRICDLSWEQASVKVPPQLQAADAEMSRTSRMVRHSSAIDTVVRGRTGLIRSVGKDWILHRMLFGKPDLAVNYGWHDPHAPHTSWSGLKMWQTVGSRHNRRHTDYSQTVTLVQDVCTVDGVSRATADVLQDAELSWCLSDDGKMPLVRYPGVSRQPIGDGPVPWQDPSRTYADRCVEWSIAQLGIKEQPLGSNTGPEVRAWLAPCERNGKRLGLTAADWCVAFACAASRASLLPGESAPHPYRAAGIEMEQWAKGAGRWSGPEGDARRGDICILKRGSEPWQRHVCRIVAMRDDGEFTTVGGNEEHSVKLTRRHRSDAPLLGFCRIAEAAPLPDVGDVDHALLDGLVAKALDELARGLKFGPES